MKSELSVADLCKLLNTDTSNLNSNTLKIFNQINRKFEPILEENLLNLYKDIFKRIDNDRQVIGSKIRTKDWQEGWGENLNLFLSNPNDNSALIPKFIRPNMPLRLFQNYISAEDPMFELSLFKVFRSFLIENYIKNYDHVYEFGCGTGFNLYDIAEKYPDIKLYGFDFVESSKLLVEAVSKHYKYNIKSGIFDFKNPDYEIEIKPNSVVCTFGALEQINSEFLDFFKYLDFYKPALVIHSEPMIEHYQLENFNDFLAYNFYKNRGYTKGLIPYLRNKARENKITLIKDDRVQFGSTLMEGFNLAIWKYN